MKLLFFVGLICFASAKSIESEIRYDHTLKESLHDFVKLIPMDDVLPIVLEAVSQDEQVIEALEFLQGPEFKKIVMTVQQMKEYTDTLQTLYNLGLDVYLYINAVHDILGLPQIENPNEYNAKQTRTLIGFIEKLQSVLPLDEFRKIYEDKMKNDDVFIAAMKAIGSPEFIKIGDVVQAMPEWAELLRRLQAKGVDTDKLLALIMDFFGWNKH